MDMDKSIVSILSQVSLMVYNIVNMGAHFGAIAIKTNKVEEVLKIADEYYHQHGLSLAEVSVGDTESKYTKVRVKDIYEFQHEYRPQKSNARVFVDFDVYFNLLENKEWIIFIYDRKAAKVTLNIDSELSKLFSKNLQTEVVEYYRYDVVNILEIRKFVEGELKDEFEIEDMQEIKASEGYFKQFSNKKYQDASLIQEGIEFPYLEQNGLNFEAEELEMYIPGQWRRFYLNGPEASLSNYFSRFNVTFEGIKSAYNLMVNSLRSMQEYEKRKKGGA